MFSSVRYNAELTLEGLKNLGLSGITPDHVQQAGPADAIYTIENVVELIEHTRDPDRLKELHKQRIACSGLA